MTPRRINHFTFTSNTDQKSFQYVPSGATSGTAVYDAAEGTLTNMHTGKVDFVTAKEMAKNVAPCHHVGGNKGGAVFVRQLTY